ncbi:NAD(P)-dependent oxidoreductase [Sphingomonas sp. TREG-RG-20F-R18-01]|uniref:NAD-dependent epimerase/dehydratase family protein n=1 Tax=Sphingomonas sp. TREG-RG-20F-R18-01 TaxID=2914982 RepID=UPI001F5738E1|nr:NAD(P)-dependent oxidoreductase [Sphingomonas sp. TREG-RG-20F-R18-01]
MKIIVTGAGGFLGAAVCRAALAAGHSVVAVARRPDPERLRGLGGRDGALTQCLLDVTDSAAVEHLFGQERPDVVVHAAWAGLSRAERDGPDQLRQLEAWCRLMQAAARAGVRKVIGIGSQAEYGQTVGRTDEATLPQPNSMYGATKVSAGLLGQRLAAEAGIGFAWLRLFAIYGPGDNPNWLIPSILATLARGESPRLTAGTQLVDYLYIDDAAEAVLAVATRPAATGIFNLASGAPVSVRAIVEGLRDHVQPGATLDFGTVPFAPGQPMHIEGAVDRLSQATGWTPRTALAAGLALTVEHFDGA